LQDCGRKPTSIFIELVRQQ